MGKFYILSAGFEANSAPTNHALAFIQGFSELGVAAEWVFLLPNNSQDRIEKKYKYITIRYLWNEKFSRNRIIKHLYKYWRFLRFYCSLRKGDTVLLLGMSAYLKALVNRRDVKVYHERTEHPTVVCSSKYRWLDRVYYKACYKADGIFVISHALKEYFESIGVARQKVLVINMVIDANRFKGIVKNGEVEPYIAYCGKASNSKDGVDDLIKAFSIVAKRNPNVRLYIIGASPPKESDNKQLVENLCLGDRINFIGIVPAEQMPQILTDAKVLALARPNSIQNKYGFPTKLGEYLLTGNPVVVTKVGDIPMFLRDRETALMTECRNIVGFADKLCWALDHPEEAAVIGQRGKEVAEKNFNYLNETRKMVDVMFGQKSN